MENIDSEEILKFEKLADDWWDPEGDFKSLHQINPLRVNYIKEKSGLTELEVLDIGCGGGILAEAMSNLGGKVTAIDVSEKIINIAKAHAEKIKSNVNYEHTTTQELVKQDNKFDVITCLEILEHVPNPFQLVKDCASLCKEGGHVFFSTINRNPRSFIEAVLGAEYLLGLLPKGTHDYAKFIKPSEISEWLRRSNLELKEIIGLRYNPITDHYRLDKNIQVNYMIHSTLNKK